jgi:hypothetical protein
MDLTEGSETSAQLISLTPGKYPKESIHRYSILDGRFKFMLVYQDRPIKSVALKVLEAVREGEVAF